MKLTILGNSSGGPFHGRHYTAQVLEVGNHLFLIDCGEGTQMQLYKFRVKYDKCNHLFISHLHGDHVFGILGLITNWCLKKRTVPLHLYSPPGLQEMVETVTRICGVRFTYELVFHVIDFEKHTLAFENNEVSVFTIPLNHRSPTSGWLFREKTRPRNIRPEQIEAYQIPFDLIPGIKAGQDLVLEDGRVIANETLTIDPPKPRAYAFCSDTSPSDLVANLVAGVDLLYHEATFTAEHLEEAAISYHSTAAQAADIARKAGVKKLLLGHFSGRYYDETAHLIEAQAIFEAVETVVEGQCYTV